MRITQISTMNFYGSKSALVKNTAKKINKVTELIKPADDFVNYTQSSYSVPTGDFPASHEVKRYPFSSDSNVIANEYIKIKDDAKPEENVIGFVSESSIIK